MRIAAPLLSLFLLTGAAVLPVQGAQTPARGGLALTVTDPAGVRLPEVDVELLGPSDREGQTDSNGQISFASIQAGTYRLRFAGEGVIAFEREVMLAAGKVLPLDITLHRAPERRDPLDAVPAPPVGQVGSPLTASIIAVLEREFIGREPRQESLLSCSGALRATMIQLNDTQPARLYDTADAVYYVVGGEGIVDIDGREQRIDTNDFVSIPRGTLHAFQRRGSRTLVLLAALSGAPCEEGH